MNEILEEIISTMDLEQLQELDEYAKKIMCEMEVDAIKERAAIGRDLLKDHPDCEMTDQELLYAAFTGADGIDLAYQIGFYRGHAAGYDDGVAIGSAGAFRADYEKRLK